MAVQRISLSMSGELAAALDHIAAQRSESRSSVVEMLLREHAIVTAAVETIRQGGSATPALPRHDRDTMPAGVGRD